MKILPMRILITMGILAAILLFYAAPIQAASNIDNVYHWAWNSLFGWLDFLSPAYPNVNISATELTGVASSSIGGVILNCASPPDFNDCTPSFNVINDGNGNLSGWGWNDTVGWVSFCGGQSTPECPGSVVYRVVIDGSGNFNNYAWNNIVGWVAFNCSDQSACGVSDYKVKTNWGAAPVEGWLESVVFDTGAAQGAQINSVMWRGSNPNGSLVKIQLAVSNLPAGPWVYDWDTNQSSSPNMSPNIPVPVSYVVFPSARYYRYKIYLYSSPDQTTSPQVEDVVVNWSR